MNIFHFLWCGASQNMKVLVNIKISVNFSCWFSKNGPPDNSTKTADMLWYLARSINSYFQEGWTSAYGDFFLGGGNEDFFAKWPISSNVRVQIGRELVRLITLIGLNKFLTNITSPTSLKKFSRTTFRWSIAKKVHFWCFKGFHRQFYLLNL